MSNAADFSPQYREQIATKLKMGHGSFVPHAPKKRLRQQEGDGMNGTERAFKAWLETNVLLPGEKALSQAVTLKIANGCRYTPDFVVRTISGAVHAFEVKGFMRDDAAVKIKVAASVYPWIRFTLVTKAKGGTWAMQEILP